MVENETNGYATNTDPTEGSRKNSDGLKGNPSILRWECEEDFRALAEKADTFKIISDNALHGNAIFDFEGRILYANNCFLRLFGYEIAEMRQLRFSSLCSPEQLQIVRDLKEEFIAKGGIAPMEARGLHRNGQEFPLLASGIVFRNEKNESQYIASSFIDLTEQKRLESQLYQAQKMESLGNFVGGIAHDFNNLLFPIIGISDMLLDTLPTGGIEWENAREILNAGLRGSELVKQILAFSRQSEHKLVPVRIQNIIKEVLKLSRRAIPANIRIVHDIQMNCGFVLADAVQIHQLTMNLISNAAHAVDEHNGSITVLLKEITGEGSDPPLSCKSGKYVQLSVADNGCGIRSSDREKIFEPYFTTKSQGKGTGLGLSVVYGIVNKLGGEIKLQSETGKGSVFHIFLPIMKAYSESARINETEEPFTETMRILLVDDDVHVARLGQQLLDSLGHQVTSRTSSIEALELFREDPLRFDLVVTDMSMPNMTGEELAKEIIALRRDIPIILCTGFSRRMNKDKAAEMGIKGFLMKPMVRAEMAKMIRTVMAE